MRTIVADMLLNMDDKLNKTKNDIKHCQGDITQEKMRLNEINMKLDRDAKIRDLVDQLKVRIMTIVSETMRFDGFRPNFATSD